MMGDVTWTTGRGKPVVSLSCGWLERERGCKEGISKFGF